jgi:DNA-directed RNA polymerase subunit M/transcription elongation factor TFIIS
MNVDCKQCGHPFEVPENKAGQTVDCPSCSTPVPLPSKVRIRVDQEDVKLNNDSGSTGLSLYKPEQPEPEPEQPAEVPPPEAESQPGEPDLIRVNCPSCDQHLKVPVELNGTVIDCPSCDGKMPISNESPAPQSAPDIKIECPSCQQHLVVPNELEGQAIDCPACNTKVPIPEATPPELPSNEVTPPVEKPAKHGEPSFWRLIGRAFVLNGAGFAMLGALYAFSILFRFLMNGSGYVPFIGGFLPIVIWIGYCSWMFDYAKQTIVLSASGGWDLPELFGWTDQNASDLFINGFVQLIGIVLCCISPFILIVLLGFNDNLDQERYSIAWVWTLGLGAFMCPVVTLCVSIFDGSNVLFYLMAALRGMKIFFFHYCVIHIISIVVVFSIFLLFLIQVGASLAVEFGFYGSIGMVVLLLAPLIILYLIIVSCRLLGYMYYANRRKLRWLGEKQ